MRRVLASGVDVDAWDEVGMTALLHAVFRGDAEGVQLLLWSGANPNRAQREDPSATPLWHATEDFGLDEIAGLLQAFGGRT